MKRQIGIDHEHWMKPQMADKAIEALKARLEREGVNYTLYEKPRYAVIIAQWRKLCWQGKTFHNKGVRHRLRDDPLDPPRHHETQNEMGGLPADIHLWDDQKLDALIIRLGKWLRT